MTCCIFVFQNSACGTDAATSFMVFYENHGISSTRCVYLNGSVPWNGAAFHFFDETYRKYSNMHLNLFCRRQDLFATPDGVGVGVVCVCVCVREGGEEGYYKFNLIYPYFICL